MKWLFFFLLPALSATKVTVQGYFSKGKVKTTADLIKFNGFLFMFSAIALTIIACFSIKNIPSGQTIIFALVLSLLAISFQCFYVLSFKTGAVSLSTTVANFGIVLPIVFSTLFYNDKLTLFKIIGFVLIACTFILIPSSDKKTNSLKVNKRQLKTSKKWFIFIILATLSTGSASIFQNISAKTPVRNEVEVLTALTYIFATIFSFILLPIVKSKTSQPLYKSDIKVNIGLFIMGITLGLYNMFAIIAQSFIPATEFFPTTSGLNILFAVITTAITFKEIPSFKQFLAIILTIVAVVIINLS